MYIKRGKNVTATGVVYSAPVVVYGIVVNSHSSGTLKLWNNTTGAIDAVFGSSGAAYSFPTGSSVITFPAPIYFDTGVFATVGGTLDCNLLVG